MNYPNIAGYGFGGFGRGRPRVTGVAGVMGTPGDFHWHGATGRSGGWIRASASLWYSWLTRRDRSRFEHRLMVNALVYQALE